MAATNFKETSVFKKAFGLAMEIFSISKKFSKEETYSLTDQIRHGRQEVCVPILRRRIENEDIPHTLFPRFPIAMPKIVKHKYDFCFH